MLVADPRLTTLSAFRRRRRFQAPRGQHGMGAGRHGRQGTHLHISVPIGTIVTQLADDGQQQVLADLAMPRQEILVARGGRGGRGNTHFATATHQAPHFAERGAPGEEVRLRLDLKLLADVGIVGYPNVGKSTLLAAMTHAHPKIGSYPFTTTSPNLGVIVLGYDAFVVADIPGLIEGASQGVGLGHEFLRHIERTKILLHVLDGTSPHLLDDVAVINRELTLFAPALAEKPQILVVNKLDLPEVAARRSAMEQDLAAPSFPVFFVSAVTGVGVAELIQAAARHLAQVRQGDQEGAGAAPAYQVFQPRPVAALITVLPRNGSYEVAGADTARLPQFTDWRDPAALAWLRRTLTRLGITRALRRAGVRPGDLVKIGSAEFRWPG